MQVFQGKARSEGSEKYATSSILVGEVRLKGGTQPMLFFHIHNDIVGAPGSTLCPYSLALCEQGSCYVVSA